MENFVLLEEATVVKKCGRHRKTLCLRTKENVLRYFITSARSFVVRPIKYMRKYCHVEEVLQTNPSLLMLVQCDPLPANTHLNFPFSFEVYQYYISSIILLSIPSIEVLRHSN